MSFIATYVNIHRYWCMKAGKQRAHTQITSFVTFECCYIWKRLLTFNLKSVIFVILHINTYGQHRTFIICLHIKWHLLVELNLHRVELKAIVAEQKQER